MQTLNSIKYNFLGEEISFEEADAVVVPVLYSSTSSFLSSKEGAKEIIEASTQIENFDTELKIPKFYTLDFIEQVVEPKKMQEIIYAIVDEIFLKKKFPVVIGGEHSIAIASFKAAYKNEKAFPIVFDAHADFREEFEGSKFSHACTSKRIKEISKEIFVIGVRSLSKEELKERESIVFAKELKKNFEEKINEIIDKIKSEKIYISFDLDFLDPAFLPSVANPEPFGFNFEEAIKAIEIFSRKKEVVGIDFCEFSPTIKQYSYLAAKFITINVAKIFENKNKK
jgi:agmatinase